MRALGSTARSALFQPWENWCSIHPSDRDTSCLLQWYNKPMDRVFALAMLFGSRAGLNRTWCAVVSKRAHPLAIIAEESSSKHTHPFVSVEGG
jgi:hypothetical protein